MDRIFNEVAAYEIFVIDQTQLDLEYAIMRMCSRLVQKILR